MKKMIMIVAGSLLLIGFVAMTAVAVYKDAELDDLKIQYRYKVEFADAMQTERDRADTKLAIANAEIESLKFDVAHYQRIAAEMTAKQQQEEPAPEEIDPDDLLVPLELPALPTNVKLFTDYRAYNLPSEPQYKLQAVSRTDENGLRRYGEDYLVGMGSFYFTEIGGRFKITLDTGNTFTVMLGDMKADADTDERGMYGPCTNYSGEPEANVLEFIIDKEVLPKEVYAYGSVDRFDFLRGNITKIAYLGKADFLRE